LTSNKEQCRSVKHFEFLDRFELKFAFADWSDSWNKISVEVQCEVTEKSKFCLQMTVYEASKRVLTTWYKGIYTLRFSAYFNSRFYSISIVYLYSNWFKTRIESLLMKLFPLFFALFFLSVGWSQSTIDLHYPGAENDSVYLAYHLGDKQYIKDTLNLNAKGKCYYDAKEMLPGGAYMIVFPKYANAFTEFLWDGKHVAIKVNDAGETPTLTVSKNVVAEKFDAYVKQLAEYKARDEKLQEESQKEALDKEVKKYVQAEINANKTNQYGQFLQMIQDVTIPESLTGKAERFYYYRDHYLDHIPFEEAWILNTPVLWGKIEYYLDRLTVQHPDSIIQSIDFLVGQFDEKSESFQFAVVQIFNKYAKSKLMTAGNIYVHMAETYYLNGRAFWAEESQIKKIKDRYLKMKYNTIGSRAIDFQLNNKMGEKVSLLEQSSAEYTVLFFWDSGCGHCEDVANELTSYSSTKPSEVTIIGVHTDVGKVDAFPTILQEEKHPWNDFQMTENTSKVYYDIYATPVIYVLDRNKTIIAKRISVEQMADLIARELEE